MIGSLESSRGFIPDWKIEVRDKCVVYEGAFAIFGPGGHLLRKVSGRIVEWPGLPTDVFVCNPPGLLRKHPKGPCLQLLTPNGSWFKLHWQRPPRDFDTSRAYVERILSEAFLGPSSG